jgi:hypothetical protein
MLHSIAIPLSYLRISYCCNVKQSSKAIMVKHLLVSDPAEKEMY